MSPDHLNCSARRDAKPSCQIVIEQPLARWASTRLPDDCPLANEWSGNSSRCCLSASASSLACESRAGRAISPGGSPFMNTGNIVQVIGPVVDVDFADAGGLPGIY